MSSITIIRAINNFEREIIETIVVSLSKMFVQKLLGDRFVCSQSPILRLLRKFLLRTLVIITPKPEPIVSLICGNTTNVLNATFFAL